MKPRYANSSRLSSIKQENQKLKRAVEELSLLNDLAGAIGGSRDLEQIMQTVIHRSLQAVRAEQGIISLVDEGATSDATTLVRTLASSRDLPEFHVDQCLLGWMVLNKKPLLLNDPQGDARFRGVRFHESVRSVMCVPMMVKSQLVGVMTACNKEGGKEFAEEDRRLFAIIASQSAQVIENARLCEEEKKLLRMQEEVKLASRIQSDLLPKAVPRVHSYDIAAKTIPAEQIGGDYFDFVEIDKARLAICLGDVSGKGLPASLLMANLQATLRAQAVAAHTPTECLSRCNRLLFNSTSPEKYATLFYGILEPQKHKLRYSNAGSEHPVLLASKDDVIRLDTGGVPLGMFNNSCYADQEMEFTPGQLLVIFSDGLREALSCSGEQFGEQGIIELTKKHRVLSACDLVEKILFEIKLFVGKNRPSDDMTVIVVKRE